LELSQPSLGAGYMDDPPVDLESTQGLVTTTFGLTDTFEYECPSWDVDKITENL